ncbi:MAG: sulfotransferase domain-containing protein [Magnetococcales bacterium]|nr:sulfotransferase domain-containing protein [Magnetococcales bacterium]
MPNATIVHLTVFKSGTVLFRRIIEDLTGLPCFEPAITPGKVDYQDADQLHCKEGHFYSWHLYPTPAVRKIIMESAAKPVMLLRNIYDLPVSMYYHFAKNIDAEIGRGRNVEHHFSEISRQEGLDLIIDGFTKPDFIWPGIGTHLQHMEMMFTLADEHPSFITSYERLVSEKQGEVERLADMLDITVDSQTLSSIVENSRFDVMKAKAVKNNTASHFRKGTPKSHLTELTTDQIDRVKAIMQQQAPRLEELARRFAFHEILECASD